MSGTLDIRLLGRFEVIRDGVALALPPSRKTRALLAFLVAADEAILRERLCDLFFEGPADPRAALRWSLTKLRPLVDNEPRRLVTEREHVAFRANTADVDLTVYRRLLGTAPEQAPTERLEAAARCYRGELLEDLDLPECHRFGAWLTGERETLHVRQDWVLTELVRRLEARPDRALNWAAARLRLNPYAECAHADMVRILGRLGRRDEALKQHQRCCRMLAEELGVQPSETLREAYAGLFAGPPRAPAAPPVRSADDSEQEPLIGREAEQAGLHQWLNSATGATLPQTLWLTGEPGIGKSRLLSALAARVRANGGQTLAGRGFEVEMARPHGAWIDLLNTLPRRRIPAALQARLAHLRPAQDAEAPARADRNRLFAAVAELLPVLAATAAPLLIILDDVQWLDKASISLLHYVIRQTAGKGVLFACALRPAELEDNAAAMGLRQALRHDGRLHDVTVAPLDVAATERLVRSLSPNLNGARIHRHSQGNPLFALELARALQCGAPALSPTLDALLGQRLAGLGAAAQALLPWAAALGHGFELSQLGEVSGQPAAELVVAVETLEKRRLFKVLHDGRYDFNHDLIREAAYQRISPPRRRLIHARIAKVLAAGRVEARASELAFHARLAEDTELAVRASVTAARYGLKLFAYDQAAAEVAHAMAALDQLPASDRLRHEIDLLGIWVHPGMSAHRPRELKARLRRAAARARRAAKPALVQHCFYLIANVHYQAGDAHHALQQTLRAESAGREADPVTVVRAIADTAKCLGMLQRQMPRVNELAREARALAEQIEEDFYEIHLAIGLVRHYSGQWQRALAHYQRALALARGQSGHWWEIYCLTRLPMLELERGRRPAARRWCRELLPLADKMGLTSEAAFARALDALAQPDPLAMAAQGRLKRALTALRDADSQWMLAYVQILAARCNLAAGYGQAARERAREALVAASTVDQHSEMALAHTLLAEVAWLAGDAEGARACLDAVAVDFADPPRLSRRARRAYTRGRRRFDSALALQR